MHNPTRFSLCTTLFLTWLSLAGPGYAHPVHDSIVRSDTTLTRIVLKPLRPWSITLSAGVSSLGFTDDPALMPPPLASGCDTFTTGKGTAPYLEAGVLIPLAESLSLHPTLAYRSFAGEHTFGQFLPTAGAGGSNRTISDVEFDHVITTHSKGIGVDLLMEWAPLAGLRIEAGPALYFLFSQTYEKVIRAVTPGDLVHAPNGDTVREYTESSGALPAVRSIVPAALIRVGYEVSLSKHLFAMPNVSGFFPLSGISDYTTLRSVQGGIGFRYELSPGVDTLREQYHEQIERHIQVPDVPQPKRFAVDIEAFAAGPGGTREQVARLEVQEVKARNAFPLLNYIFFDSASAAIAPRYVRYKNADEAARIFRGSMERRGERTNELYLETLNIIGDRMRKQPQTTIRLIGSTCNCGAEEDNAPLGKQRAEAVKDYLVRTWSIDPSRIVATGRLLPEKPSPNTSLRGQAENRRVEIVASDERLTDPLYVTNIEHTANPPQLIVKPTFPESDTNIDYHISMRIAGKEIQRFDGNTSGGGAQSKDWTITEEALSAKADSLEIVLDANTQTGRSATARTSIKLEQHRIEREEEQKIDRFSLILFNFDESALGSKNERILGLVADALKRIKPSRVIIRGYTDEMGDDDHNRQLSGERAQRAGERLRNELRKRGVDLPANTLIEGKGSHEGLYDNALPEGRFLSRTVMVTIER